MVDGNPNGKIKAEAPAMCYTNEGGLWFKTNTGYNWDGWENFLAETT